MNRFGWIVGALALVACNKDKEGESGETGEEVSCEVQITETDPAGGSSDFYYRGTIQVAFTADGSDGTVTLTDSAGAEVSGSTSWSDDGTVLYFTPSSPLSPSTDYTLSISYCGGEPSVSFRTSEVGAETDSNSLVGKAYSIDLGSANFIEPEGIGTILGELLTQNILVGVTAADDTSIQMIGAISGEGTEAQDLCTPSIPFPEADFSENPFFEIGPEDTTITVAGYSATIGDLQISGAFGPDLDYFSGGVLGGVIDTTTLDDIPDLAELASCDGTDDACLCNFIGGTGLATCSECPDGSGPYCLTLLADHIVANEIDGSLEVRTEADIAADATCD